MAIISDMHVHSSFSVDAVDDINSLCESAIQKGLKYICFTDHCDFNPKDPGVGRFRFNDYSRAIESARDRFGDRICILKGVEFGEPHLYPKQFEAIVAQDFDVVLASVHWIGDLGIDQSLLERFTIEQVYEKYYQQVLAAVKFGGFDVLAHLDFPKRYLGNSAEPPDLIDEILKEIVAKGISLEVNTSSIRKGLSESLPGRSLLERYAEAGGARVTVGSDSHSRSDIAHGFSYVDRLLASCRGLRAGVYRGRKFEVER